MLQNSSPGAQMDASYSCYLWLASSLEEVVHITDSDWNHFQLIWTTQFYGIEEGCDYEYTPAAVLVSGPD